MQVVWMVLGNVIEPEMGLEVLHNVAAEKDAVEMVTPYIYHYYIEALLKCGAKKDEALAVMKKLLGRNGRTWCRHILGII